MLSELVQGICGSHQGTRSSFKRDLQRPSEEKQYYVMSSSACHETVCILFAVFPMVSTGTRDPPDEGPAFGFWARFHKNTVREPEVFAVLDHALIGSILLPITVDDDG